MRDLFVVSGASGAGKSSILKALVNKLGDIRISVSHTTRPPRGKEQNGVNYHFTDQATFRQMIDSGAFVEWTQIHGNFYGTSRAELESIRQGDMDLIFEIEGHGAGQIKGQFPEARCIFILTPSLEELRRRLESRGEDSPDEVERRMKNAINEIQYIEHFDYVIINDSFEQAVADMETIVRAERLARKRVWPKIADRFKG